MKSDIARTRIIATIVLVILFVTWWMNGGNDTWVYITSGIAVSMLFFPIFFKKK